MPLCSFLLKPMQRITRYPLHIKNVGDTSLPVFPSSWNSWCLDYIAHNFFFLKVTILAVRLDPGVHGRGPRWPASPERGPGEGRRALPAGLVPPCSSFHYSRSSEGSFLMFFVEQLRKPGKRGCEREGELWQTGVAADTCTVWGHGRGMRSIFMFSIEN